MGFATDKQYVEQQRQDDEADAVYEDDVKMADEEAEFEPERVARNLALHIAAADGNLEECKVLLNAAGTAKGKEADGADEAADAWWEDRNHLRWSALQFAVHGGHTDVVRLLLRCGAIWNAVDDTGLTAADIAWSMNDEETYQVLFEEGVRQTLVLNLLNRQGHADSLSRTPGQISKAEGAASDGNSGEATLQLLPTESADEVSAQNERFLKSRLTFVRDEEGKMRCVDQDGGLVMAAWETDVMEQTAKLLCSTAKGEPQTGLRVLNVGFGLGIIDECFQAYKLARHVIVEAHPDAIAFAKQNGWHEKPGVELLHSRWEDALDILSGNGELFDVIYWDTYAQGYGEMRDFFQEVPYLLASSDDDDERSLVFPSKFSFFHGLAGVNRFLYDVYTRVSELDLREVGLDTTWYESRPQTTSETWNGIKRKYWDLDVLRIPISTLVSPTDDE